MESWTERELNAILPLEAGIPTPIVKWGNSLLRFALLREYWDSASVDFVASLVSRGRPSSGGETLKLCTISRNSAR